jgi:hypothetical protein
MIVYLALTALMILALGQVRRSVLLLQLTSNNLLLFTGVEARALAVIPTTITIVGRLTNVRDQFPHQQTTLGHV